MDNTLNTKDYVFDNVDNLVEYLFHKFGKLSPLKLQKGLYFLYAYYGGQYGESKESDGVIEQSYSDYPNRLFNADFEAWTYGPVIREVWKKHKDGQYNLVNEPNVEGVDREILMFIDDLFEQINSVSDFSLVDRSHEDKTWKNAFDKGQSTKLNNDNLILEYKEKYIL